MVHDPANAAPSQQVTSDRGLEVRLRDTFGCRIAYRRREVYSIIGPGSPLGYWLCTLLI